VLHSWLARQYVPIESQGAGIARQFDFGQVVWISAIAAMGRRGIPIGTAAGYLHAVERKFIAAVRKDSGRDMVLTVTDSGPDIMGESYAHGLINDVGGEMVDGVYQRPESYFVLLIHNLVTNTRTALRKARGEDVEAAPAPSPRRRRAA
jgi:hypothetical protein